MNEKTSTKTVLTKSLFIIGVIVIISVLSFAIIRLAPKLFNSFASVGSFVSSKISGNSIKVISDKNEINSGDAVILSWEYEPKENKDKELIKSYSIKYSCAPDLNLKISTNEGQENIDCDKPYLIGESKKAELFPFFKKENDFTDLDISISYGNKDLKSTEASGKVTINVKNESQSVEQNASTTKDVLPVENSTTTTSTVSEITPKEIETATTTEKQKETVAPTKTYVRPSYADIVISNISFTNNSVQFVATNIGTKSTSNWYYRYSTPNNGIGKSTIQPVLRPGQSIKYNLRFINDFSEGQIIINLNSDYSFKELNTYNNYKIIPLQIVD